MKIANSPRLAEKNAEKNFLNGVGISPYANAGLTGWNNAVAPAGGNTAQRMRPKNKNVTLVISNSSNQTQTVTLFNAIETTSPTFADSVSVVARPASYTFVLNSISSQPFKIQGLKYLCRYSAAQFSNTFSIGTHDMYKHNVTDGYVIQDNTSAMNNQSLELDDPYFEMDVTLQAFIEIDVNGTDTVTTTGEQVTLIFTIAGYINNGDALNLQPNLNVNPNGFNNGLPDMTTTLVVNPSGLAPVAPASGGITKGRGLFG